VQEESGAILMPDVPIQVEMVIVDTSLVGHSGHVEVVDALLDHAVEGEASAPVYLGGICLDLVVLSPGPSPSGDQALGRAIQAPRPLSAVDLRVAELDLSGYPGVPLSLVSCRQVEGSAD
jgi:hypothetical protein